MRAEIHKILIQPSPLRQVPLLPAVHSRGSFGLGAYEVHAAVEKVRDDGGGEASGVLRTANKMKPRLSGREYLVEDCEQEAGVHRTLRCHVDHTLLQLKSGYVFKIFLPNKCHSLIILLVLSYLQQEHI